MNMNCTSCDTAFDASHAALDCPSCGSAVQVPLPLRRTAVVACEAGTARNVIAAALKQLGFDLVIYPSSAGLLEELRQLRPQLAILNVTLDGGMGLTLCERARQDSSLDSTRFVLLGSIHRPDRFRAKPRSIYGADAYLEEPSSVAEVRRVIEALGVDTGWAGSRDSS